MLFRSSNVKLVVTDMQGRQIAVLFDGATGNRTVDVDVSSLKLTSGVYNYVLTSSDVVLVRQMVVTR